MTTKPLFVLFINSSLSTKLVALIETGKINAIIYCPNVLILKIKKIFTKKTLGNFKIFELNLPFNSITFNLLFTSRNFWDNIDNTNLNIYVVYNPLALSLTFQILAKQPKPFFIYPLKQPTITKKLIHENPSIFDELLPTGFLFYIKPKFAKKTIKNFSKKNILTIRENLNMKNNEYIKRLTFVPFYMFFYHNMLELGYND